MTTQTINTVAGEIPSPSNWANDGFAADDCGCDEGPNVDYGDPSVLFLEKAVESTETIDGKTTIKDINGALEEYKRLHKAGIASPGELLTLSRAYPDNKLYANEIKKMGVTDDDKLVIGGPASIELVDREGHLITTNALSKAFDKYMENFRTRNAMVLHSDVQVGWALPAYISKSGQIFKSGISGNGLFFITELRNDTKIAKKVQEQINSGKLKSYSIAGSALKTENIQKGLQDVMRVDELELAEVTVCEKGVNQAASFEIIKSETPASSSCIDGSCLLHLEEKEDDDKTEEATKDFTKEEVSYQPASEGQLKAGFKCGTCKYFIKESNKCTIIEGSIDSDYWCTQHSGNTHEGPSEEKSVQKQEVNLVMKADGNINFTQTFLDYFKKEFLTGSVLYNTQARQEEHHRLLEKYGFPGELESEYARNTPVTYEMDPSGHSYVPWAVNEAGENLAIRHYDEALTPPQIGQYKKRGVIEGGNSSETPVKQLNTTEGFSNLLNSMAREKAKKSAQGYAIVPLTISKAADDFFNWMAQDAKHMYKSNCPCEMCFQKSSDYRGTIEKVADFLD